MKIKKSEKKSNQPDIRTAFLEKVREIIQYWSTLPKDQASIKRRCRGVAFSILAEIDGESSSLPPFYLIPVESGTDLLNNDISGDLHNDL